MSELDGLSADELRGRLAELFDRLAAMSNSDPAWGSTVAQRLDVAAALRRATADDRNQLAAWAERSRHRVDDGRPFIASYGEGGGYSG